MAYKSWVSDSLIETVPAGTMVFTFLEPGHAGRINYASRSLMLGVNALVDSCHAGTRDFVRGRCAKISISDEAVV